MSAQRALMVEANRQAQFEKAARKTVAYGILHGLMHHHELEVKMILDWARERGKKLETKGKKRDERFSSIRHRG